MAKKATRRREVLQVEFRSARAPAARSRHAACATPRWRRAQARCLQALRGGLALPALGVGVRVEKKAERRSSVVLRQRRRASARPALGAAVGILQVDVELGHGHARHRGPPGVLRPRLSGNSGGGGGEKWKNPAEFCSFSHGLLPLGRVQVAEGASGTPAGHAAMASVTASRLW